MKILLVYLILYNSQNTQIMFLLEIKETRASYYTYRIERNILCKLSANLPWQTFRAYILVHINTVIDKTCLNRLFYRQIMGL